MTIFRTSTRHHWRKRAVNNLILYSQSSWPTSLEYSIRFTLNLLTPMPRKCTLCTYRYKTAWEATKTAFFLRFARVTLTGRQFCGFLRKENKILIIIIIINLIKREARFAIFEIGKFFQGSLSYKNYVIRKAFQCASRIGA